MIIDVIASGSKGNAYLVKNKDTTLLLECGVPLKQLRKVIDLTEITACLVTHEHKDHALEVEALARLGIPIYLSPGTSRMIPNKYDYMEEHISPGETLTIGSFQVMAQAVVHDAEEPVCFFIEDLLDDERLVFATDTAYLKYNFKGATHLMVECNYVLETLDRNVEEGGLNLNLRNRIVRTHMGLDNFLNFLDKQDLSCVKRIYVLHLSEYNSDWEVIKRTVQDKTGKEVVIC